MHNSIGVVIRKRIPKDRRCRWLYMYLNSPISAICFRATLARIYDASNEEAMSLSHAIGMPQDAIASYIGSKSEVGCYVLDEIQRANHQVTLTELAATLNIHPPQGFLILSREATDFIETVAHFKKHKSRDIE